MVIGKPAAQYFLAALKDMQVNPEEVNVEIIKIINFFFYSTVGIMVFQIMVFFIQQ